MIWINLLLTSKRMLRFNYANRETYAQVTNFSLHYTLQTIKNRTDVWLCPTFSLFSKSSLKAHSLRRAGSSVMEARVSRNCSALPSGMSGFATWASWIFDLSSSVGSIVNSFCSNKNNVSVKHPSHQYPKQLSLCVYPIFSLSKAKLQFFPRHPSWFEESKIYYWLSLVFAKIRTI